MAERRMFAKTIVLSDSFLDMSLGARCLYMTMSMLADDDGFVNNPRSIMRQTGATNDDMRLLIEKKFIIPFESGIVVIKHWRINNYLRSDRYQKTKYLDEMAMLTIDDNGAYHSGIPAGIPSSGTPSIGKDSIDKVSIGKDSIGESNNRKRFAPPTADEVRAYAFENGYQLDADSFVDFYSMKDWMVGKNRMKDWKAAVRNWCRRDRQQPSTSSNPFLEMLERGEFDD